MTPRRLLLSAAAIALAVAACVSPDTGGAVRPAQSSGPPLSALPQATAPPTTQRATTSTTTTTTTTLGVPSPPEIGTGTVCELYDDQVVAAGDIQIESIVEASGIVASQATPGAYWVINDSGNGSIVYAVDESGAELATIEIEGVLGFDWEDIAIGPGPDEATSYLYVGDIGDNLRLRSTISLLRFPEPDLSDPPTTISDVATLRFTFPGSAEDSEAMWVDPITGDIFVVTKRQKEDGKAVVYRAPAATIDTLEPTPMTAVAEFRFDEGIFVTAADVTSDGSVVAFRGYNEVWVWLRTDLTYEETFAAEPCMAPSPDEVQGEAIAFLSGELAYVTLSEGKEKPLNMVRLATP